MTRHRILALESVELAEKLRRAEWALERVESVRGWRAWRPAHWRALRKARETVELIRTARSALARDMGRPLAARLRVIEGGLAPLRLIEGGAEL